MSAYNSKSPKPIFPVKNDKETIWEKIGTLGRRKVIKEVEEVEIEGKKAIESPSQPVAIDLPIEDYELEENEERSMIEPKSYNDPKFQELLRVFVDWINDELAPQRIIVQNLEEDLYDGQVLQKLFEKLSGTRLDVPEVRQSAEGQKQKLSEILSAINRELECQSQGLNCKWTVELIHSKSIVATLHLLVALSRHYRAPIRLPEHVSVILVVVQKLDGKLVSRRVEEKITVAYDDVGMLCERDAFDTLFDQMPDKLLVVKKSLVTFVNKHLNKLNLEVTEIESQFQDGVYLILLIGLLENFFVPLYDYYLTPKDFDQKVHNVNLMFELMQDCDLPKPKARPEDIVNADLKSTLRLLYFLFIKYRHLV